jgi:hypothetical protein
MSRIKEFDSTGIAPLGRLYAGDLLAMQDAWADLSNFAQTVDVGTLRLGETGLQLLRYGAGEARLTGMLRVDEIIRGLGGVIGGTFTTTARDAIAAGKAPYGLVILNTTTNQYEWNVGTDGARVWVGIMNNTMAWTPYTPATITGWATSGRTVACSYLRVGTKTVIVNYQISGTSNATTVSFSTPALGNSSARNAFAAGAGLDNDTHYIPTSVYVAASSASITCDPAYTTVTPVWTNPGAKSAWGQIIYELA